MFDLTGKDKEGNGIWKTNFSSTPRSVVVAINQIVCAHRFKAYLITPTIFIMQWIPDQFTVWTTH